MTEVDLDASNPASTASRAALPCAAAILMMSAVVAVRIILMLNGLNELDGASAGSPVDF